MEAIVGHLNTPQLEDVVSVVERIVFVNTISGWGGVPPRSELF